MNFPKQWLTHAIRDGIFGDHMAYYNNEDKTEAPDFNSAFGVPCPIGGQREDPVAKRTSDIWNYLRTLERFQPKKEGEEPDPKYASVDTLTTSRLHLLRAFEAFDEEWAIGHIPIQNTDNEKKAIIDPNSIATTCGKSVNEVKRRFYRVCAARDPHFQKHNGQLEKLGLQEVEDRFLPRHTQEAMKVVDEMIMLNSNGNGK